MSELSEEVFVRLLPVAPSEDVDMVDAPATNGGSAHALPRQPKSGQTASHTAKLDGEHVVDNQVTRAETKPKFIIAVDFGTTFSTVAFVRVDPGTRPRLIGPESIRCIDHYPEVPVGALADAFTTNTSVPTELWYDLKKAKAGPSSFLESYTVDDDSDTSLEREWYSASSNHEDSECEEPQSMPKKNAKSTRPPPVWGHAVHNKIMQPDETLADSRHLTRFKLMLDDSDVTKTLRKKTEADIKALKAAKIIEQPVDLITDYLTQLFKHTKSQLAQSHDLRDDSLVELVLCVPTLWSEKACRTMQVAMARALETSTLAKTDRGSVRDLFLVAEPEAAAAFALSDPESVRETHRHDTIQILDCGGGTVDAITYTVTQTSPLRLREVVPAHGDTCGSSFLNEKLSELLHTRLSGVELVGNNGSLDSVIRAKVVEWENGVKRRIDVTQRDQYIDPIRIHGLTADPGQRFTHNRLQLDRKELINIFKEPLQGVSELMRRQLRAAEEKELSVSRVILIGGFGQSPSLKSHLEKVLRKERNYRGLPIELKKPKFVDSAVARGAVLRALRKEDGPVRITRTSYGVLRSDLYDKNEPAHKGLKGRRDRADGQLYIKDTIKWLILKVIQQSTLISRST